MQTKRCKLCFNCVRVAPEYKFTCLKDMWGEREFVLETVNSSIVLDTVAKVCTYFDDDENGKPTDWGEKKKTGNVVKEIRLGEDVWQKVY